MRASLSTHVVDFAGRSEYDRVTNELAKKKTLLVGDSPGPGIDLDAGEAVGGSGI